MSTPEMKENREVSLALLVPHARNYRKHPILQIQRMKASLERFGQGRSIVIQEHDTGKATIIAGHGVVQAAKELGWSSLRADILPKTWSDTQIMGYLLADNLLSQQGIDDEEALTTLLEEQMSAGYTLATLGTDDESMEKLLEYVREDSRLPDEIVPPKGLKPNPRNLPIDVIYTLQMADCTCCLAAQSGIRYGIQSAHYRLCPYTHELSGRHRVYFVDNDYFHYDHEVHLSAVRSLRPKYATVKDIMTRTQCEKSGIDYTPLEQILEWGIALQQYAENVILIPKYDCLERIPESFMLGYSIPSSHGGTPLHIEAFRGRRVHLLGGSWEAQLSAMAALGDDVASVDNNQIQLLARRFGMFVYPDGKTQTLNEIGLGMLVNPRYVALAISFGAMAAKVQELYGKQEDLLEEEEAFSPGRNNE